MEHPEKLEVVRKLHFTAPTPLKKADKSSHCSISIVPPSHMSKKHVRHAHDFKSQGEKKKHHFFRPDNRLFFSIGTRISSWTSLVMGSVMDQMSCEAKRMEAVRKQKQKTKDGNCKTTALV